MKEIKAQASGKKPPVIHVTRDYGMFKRMEGNREVTARRAREVRTSIERIGLIPVPIVVNEHLEVIDGQGRLEAISQLELPVFYIIVPGLGLQDCVAMNVNTTPWRTIDYIKSYAETGNDNYKRLLKLINGYELPESVIICAATGVMSTANPSVKTGGLELPEEYYFAVDAMLAYVERFAKVMKENGISNRSPIYNALCFCYQCESVDNERMFSQFVRYSHKLNSARKTDEVLETLTEIYNFGRKKDRVYIATKYREYLDGKYAWYSSYWGVRAVAPRC